MEIKIKYVKQRLTGLAFMLIAFIAAQFSFEGEVGFAVLMLGLGGLWLLVSKNKFYDHDYIFIFDVDKFRGLR